MLEYWYEALRSATGVRVHVSDKEKGKRLLYAARKEAHDPALEAISVRDLPNKPNELWLVHNARSQGTPSPTEGNS